MKQDKKGFIYPEVDMEKCSKCGICIQKCQYNDARLLSYSQKYYAARHKNEDILLSSSSGGVSSELVNSVLSNGGVCVGAVYDSDFCVKHVVIENIEDAERLKTSKYAQSDISECLLEIKKLLKEKITVLFIGTPCQVSALYNFLGVEYDNLICCDIICGGVPSPLVLKKYLNELKSSYQSEIISLTMKDKSNGWLTPTLSIEFRNGKSFSQKLYDTPFGKIFLNQISVRDCCKECVYSKLDRVGDITIGDFWSVNKYYPDSFDNKGISTVITNSEKGEKLWATICDKFDYFSVTQEEVMQNRLCGKNNYCGDNTDVEFWNRYSEDTPLEMILTKPSPNSQKLHLLRRIKQYLINILPFN